MGVPLEQVIAHNLSSLFHGMDIQEYHLFRITRNADLAVQEDEGDDLFDDPAGSKKVAQNTTDDDAAAEARDDYEEEKKEAAEVNPELMDMLRRQRSNDPFSASQKIAEMGLSREPSHAAASAAQAAQQLTAKMMDQNQQRDFGRIVSEGLTPVRVSAGADAEEDSDSDDLF